MNCNNGHFTAVGKVLRTDGEVQPEVVELLLDDELVPRAAVDADLHQEGGVLHGLGTVATDEVCGVAAQMVRVLVAAHLGRCRTSRTGPAGCRSARCNAGAGLPTTRIRGAGSLLVPVPARCKSRGDSMRSPSP